MSRKLQPTVLATAGLLALAAGQRVWNAFHYPINLGFDALGNWDYIELLMKRWALPAPGAGWSTAHPPLFYALGAMIGRFQAEPDASSVGLVLVLLCSAIGLAAVATTAWLVHELSGGNGRRTVIAVSLIVFLPVHIMMSGMLSEELLTSALSSFTVVGLVAEMNRREHARTGLLRPALLGGLAGLALLTKLSGAMLVAAGTLALLAEGPLRGHLRAVRSAVVFALAAGLVGGWFYLRNLLLHGYLYPHGLAVHAMMLELPPGERGLIDYFFFPLDSFRGTRAEDPALLHSVWGGTYASVWFDSHRHFLRAPVPGLFGAAQLILVTALLPTVAFVIGLLRGTRRAFFEGNPTDRLLVVLVGLMLSGYVAFTIRNPWYVTVKASFLLGLATPFAVYSSEVLDGWMGRGTWRAVGLGLALAVLFAASFVTFTAGVFTRFDVLAGVPPR